MSLRSFSRLLTRSFYPRKINRAKVESSPGIVSQAASTLVAGRPARSLHTIVSLRPHQVSDRKFLAYLRLCFWKQRGVGSGDSTYGAVVGAALTGGVGILIFKKLPVDGDVTMEDMKNVDNKPRQEDIKKDMGKHQMDVDMEAKFHEWMERMGREYPNQEEKAYRFELFKERMKQIETFTEGRVKNPLPNVFGDMTDDEIRAITNCHKPRSKEYEASLMQDYEFLKKKMEEEGLMEKAKRNVC
ncbi:unnamed protein product [Urochloa decumbens]|uniref:Cathepsin propeptide inhibitor domain-containing protein n=1 Tax=Urochloa decumbens TaxID=240449 RepID=A0ABC9E8N5_9POAL